jgi:hypothetical protein
MSVAQPQLYRRDNTTLLVAKDLQIIIDVATLERILKQAACCSKIAGTHSHSPCYATESPRFSKLGTPDEPSRT